MLDKQLCEIVGMDRFTQWLMNELDRIEDELYSPNISNSRYIELRGIYSKMLDVRDMYCKLSVKKDEVNKIKV